ncbi:hypothetical protein SAMN05421827_10928 [Pedobacter terrae]|uniref:Contractile injection system tube protein N-terminal domain-containing protein n=1 Tax=Pedobacter terrae TaxID=405671 RepID=A0A1G7VZG6_9SPHI|nr:hypothetical protein [Pedobacter terrae]SDG65061.1 hypothetical protein SAMN05421827_10928 [Pedobacter terrae]
MGSLEPMKITGYTDEQFTKRFPGPPYLMMLNPESIKWQRSIEYNQQQAPDSSSPSQRYKSTPSDKLNFDVVIDCTGIVDPKRVDMAKEISTLENIIFTYNGTIHRPNFVKVQWGKDLVFNGVLNSFDISYTLFRPDGSPLRAKISLGFGQYIAPQTVKIQDQDESPDISHLVTVVEGETLPELCKRVWHNEKYYTQVARYNGLNKFRNLKGVEKLIFPPIIPKI